MISVERELISRLMCCNEFLIANATLSRRAWLGLEPAVRFALESGAHGWVIIGLDLFQADPKALERLYLLQQRYEALQGYLFELRPQGIFHPKLGIFLHGDESSVLIGSSNLSHAAWNSNIEADVRVHDRATADRLKEQFHHWIADHRCVLIDPESIKRAEQLWNEHAQERNILMPIRKHTPRVSGSQLKSAAKYLEPSLLTKWVRIRKGKNNHVSNWLAHASMSSFRCWRSMAITG